MSSPTASCNRRGRDETLLLGAATMRPIIERLLPGASIVTRPRLSQLEFAGDRKITRQPRRTAIVAFSADEVYAIAELIRRQHGGAAVVLGSLSPRTRNAQVAMYQSGDVDYLVATDAIGMGLNLDVDHVAFASDRKYRRLSVPPAQSVRIRPDRRPRRPRHPRRHLRHHRALRAVRARTRQRVAESQLRSREDAAMAQCRSWISPRSARCRCRWRWHAGHEALTRAPIAEDLRVLDHAARDAEVREHGAWHAPRSSGCGRSARSRITARLRPRPMPNWSPRCFGFLMQKGRIPDDWFAAQIDQADRDRRRYRHPVGPDRADPDLDLRRQSSGLARRSGALARNYARGRK